MNVIDDYIDDNFDLFVNDLKDLLAQPSVSATGEGIRDCLELIQDLLEKYCFDEKHLVETDGQPAIISKAFCNHDEENDRPTLLIYGHYDVQPVDDEKWDTSPFKPTIKEGSDGRKRIFARGSGDNKGQWFSHLCAVKALRKTGDMPMNIILLLEGEEESGSPNLTEVIRKNKDILNADLALIADGPMDDSWRPNINLGTRGIIKFKLDLKGPNRNIHSGHYGGSIPNPAWELIDLIATMKDEDGSINIDGFYDKVEPVTDEKSRALKDIPFDIEKIKDDLDIKELAEGPGNSYLEKIMYYPTLNIEALTSGYQGEGPKTIIPTRASAKFDIRLVENQDPEEIFKKVEKHIEHFKSDKVEVELKRLGGTMKPYLTPLNSPYLETIIGSLKDAWGVDPLLKPVAGGSVPGYVFTDILGLHCFKVTYANPDENNHSPNENFALECFENGIKSTARLLLNLSELEKISLK